MTLLCVPIMVDDFVPAMADARAAQDAGADIIEFRVDRFFEGEGDLEGLRAVVKLVDECPLPCIVTCRSASEGGEYDGDDAGRVALWEHLGTPAESSEPARAGLHPKHPPRYIDVELSTYARSANLRQKVHLAVDHPGQTRPHASGLILSAHDFAGRPANFTRLVSDLRDNEAARVLKLAWRARSIRDNIEAFELLLEQDRPTIALCMGEFGLMSRVLAPKFGGFLTFASLRDAAATAPGQPTLRELLDLYRFRAIERSTRVFGVIGWPVTQSMSPLVHNAGFDGIHSTGFRGVYLPLPVPVEWEHFKATMHALLDFKPLDFRGASVTIPHKEHALRFAREDTSRRWHIDPLVDRCGAANTIVVDDDGSCRLMNTDALAAVDALRGVMPELSGRRIAVIGAGGAARAVVTGLVDAGATVVVYARDAEKSARFVASVSPGRVGENSQNLGKAVAGPWDKLHASCCEAYVNCTPIGMKGGSLPSESPLDIEKLENCSGISAVFDTVYNPIETPLLAAARAAGLPTVDGVEMFIAQAAAQFEAWTGRSAPRQLFDRIVRETLEAKPA